jgi:glucose-1-phosphate cytidylyltransferase
MTNTNSMDVLILCGGKGTRAYPYTEYFPKPMMPIGGTPVMVHLMRLYAAQGFQSFVLAAGHRKEIISDYFQGRFPDWNVRIVDTGAESDTGERVRRCFDVLSPRFFATYGDGLGDICLHDLLDSHLASGVGATVTAVPLRSQYGLINFDSCHRVQNFEEKPVIRDRWINAGFFVFEKTAWQDCDGSSLEQHVLPMMAARNHLNAYLHTGFWKSMDTSKDHEEMERLHSIGAPWAVAPHAIALSGG